jgi:hypothetical protein
MLAAAAVLTACASSPKNIKAAYVSPLKYQTLSCDQIALERSAVAYRSSALYRSLKHRANADAAKMGVGAVLFLPTLFFLKGNGAKAAEFAHLKGDYTALRLNAEDRGCAIAFPELESVVTGEAEVGELTARIEP